MNEQAVFGARARVTDVRNVNPLSLVFGHELRTLIADRTLLWIAALLLALLGYGLYIGFVETSTRDRFAAEVTQKQQNNQAKIIEEIHKVMAGHPPTDAFKNPVDPWSVAGEMGARYAVIPTAPLAPLAFGQSDIFPNSYQPTYRSKVFFKYDSEMENPWSLLNGHLDLAFVITFLLPLLIFATSYNLLSEEREHGTLRLLLSQPLKLVTLVLGKVAVRAALVLGVAVVVLSIVLIVMRPEARSADSMISLLCWMFLVVAYGLFWFALAVFVNSFGKSSATNALILISTWVVLVLIAPVVLNLLIQAYVPAPSRAELTTSTRVLTIKGLNRYNDLLSAEYRYTGDTSVLMPKNGRIEVAPRLRALFLMERDTDAEIEKLLDRFDAQLARQQQLVDRYGVLSPAIIVYEGMTALAGTGVKRYASFQAQVDAFHDHWKAYFEPKILQGIAITPEDFDRMPAWQWREPADDGTVSATLGRIALLSVPMLFMIAIAMQRLRRMSVV